MAGKIGFGAPQPGWDGIFLHLLKARGNAGLAEILLGQNIGRNLRKLRRYVDIGEAEHDRAIGILDLADGLAELNFSIGRLAWLW
jgi:hypothetical protein